MASEFGNRASATVVWDGHVLCKIDFDDFTIYYLKSLPINNI